MDFEGEGSGDTRTTGTSTSRPFRPLPRLFAHRSPPFSTPRTSRLSSGTDEASASHSSTNFLTPPEATNAIPPVSQPLLATSSSDTRSEAPNRTYRFEIDIPDHCFFNYRSRSSSVPTTTPVSSQPCASGSNGESSRTRPVSLSPDTDTRGAAEGGNEMENGVMRTTEDSSTPIPCTQNPPSWTNRSNPSDGTGTSTEVNDDSENEDQVGYEELHTESQSDDVPPPPSQPNSTLSVNPPTSPRHSGNTLFTNPDGG